jgi:hypothetical protein
MRRVRPPQTPSPTNVGVDGGNGYVDDAAVGEALAPPAFGRAFLGGRPRAAPTSRRNQSREDAVVTGDKLFPDVVPWSIGIGFALR